MSSSYGAGEMFYDVEGSEMDDLDNEVHNIAKRQDQNKIVKPDDIKIDFNEDNADEKMSRTVNGQKGFFEFTSE